MSFPTAAVGAEREQRHLFHEDLAGAVRSHRNRPAWYDVSVPRAVAWQLRVLAADCTILLACAVHHSLLTR